MVQAGGGGPGKGGGGGTYPVIITYQIFNFRWTNPIKNEKNDYNDRYLGWVVQAWGWVVRVGVVPTR